MTETTLPPTLISAVVEAMRDTPPLRLFEVSERHLADAFTEHLRRFTPGRERAAPSKRATADAIRRQMKEIEARLAQRGQPRCLIG